MTNEKVKTYIFTNSAIQSPYLQNICININVFTLKHDISFLSHNYSNLMKGSVDELETVNAVIRSWNCSLLIIIIIMDHPNIAS